MQFRPLLWTYVGLAGVACYYVYRRWNSIPSGSKVPPGPPGRFLIGNLLDIPTKKEWITFNRWAKEYGDLVYLKVFGVTLLFVNSYDLAKELFDKRAHIYSDRAHSIVWNELLRMDWALFQTPYGDMWRRNRAYFHQFFNQTAVNDYREVQMKHARILLKRLYKSPNDLRSHIRFTVGASILEVTYGIQASSEKDPYIVLSEETALELSRVGLPGTYFVDILPALKYIPMWFPGIKFQRELYELRKKVKKMVDEPIEFVEAALKEGKANPSVAASFIERFENDPNRPPDYEDVIRHITGSVYVAGIDTTDAGILLFFRAMLLHPQVQKRAQQELDEVVGTGALPTLTDFSRLKYIKAVVYEVMRWNTVTPAALPHVLSADDIVNGYFIPKGTVVFGTSWTLLRSESLYRDADMFKPERFLDESTPMPDFGFGYGRRICPGRYFAENSMFMVAACVLHTFNILPVLSENEPVLPGEEDYDSGVVLRPKNFKCRLEPRSSSAVMILEELDL